MYKTTLTVSGMVCGMCESRVNDAVREAFPVKKVTSSRAKGETVILSETSLDTEKLRQVINSTGYTVLYAREEQYKKPSLFSGFLKRKA